MGLLRKFPRLDYPPIQIQRFEEKFWNAGVENLSFDSVQVRVYNAEKTIADCFRYRNKLGMDIVLEALKLYSNRKNTKYDKIIEYAKINRVDKIIYPYLEAFAK